MKFQKTVKKSIVYTPTPNRSVYVIGAAGFCALIHKVLPSFRPLINKYKFSYYDDVIQCYITGNNSQSYSGY